jgi:hypothetical protein
LLYGAQRISQEAAATTVVTYLNAKLLRGTTDSFPYRVLGHSGEKVSLVGLGGHHIGSGSEGGTALPPASKAKSATSDLPDIRVRTFT